MKTLLPESTTTLYGLFNVALVGAPPSPEKEAIPVPASVLIMLVHPE